ncbi:flagellar protein FlaG [Brevundimonas naejangsanensis]|uniref:flagellar protein FlaG n=1 Tax=Brevundimonas naejangsanensis TaxID=588932 RepID=UPI00106A8F8F|nr:flagellar protein FlaG [Brevundimonas naejangsanensis]QBQ47210.1 hypothetical protein E3U41_00015 [Brevundimonas naejangsanensis]
MSEVIISGGAVILGSLAAKEISPAESNHPLAERRASSVVQSNDRPSSALDLIATTRLAIEDRDGQYVYKIYDPVTGEVLQQIPDERLLRQRESLAQSAAVLLGVKV